MPDNAKLKWNSKTRTYLLDEAGRHWISTWVRVDNGKTLSPSSRLRTAEAPEWLVEPSMASPARPQDRTSLAAALATFA